MDVRSIKGVHNTAKLPFGHHAAPCPQSAGSRQDRGTAERAASGSTGKRGARRTARPAVRSSSAPRSVEEAPSGLTRRGRPPGAWTDNLGEAWRLVQGDGG